MRRTLLAALPLAVATLAALPFASRTAGAQEGPAAAPIAALDAGLLRAMHAGRSTPFAQRYTALAPVVERAFDLRAVLEMAVGLRWKALPPDQQAALLKAFTRFTVSTYVANFDGFSGESFALAGARPQGADQVVQTKLVPAHDTPTEIDYVMRREQDGWRAVDVLLEGTISRAAVLRSDFRSLLAGGDAHALIDNLNGKSDELARK